MSIGLRAFLVIADSLQQKEGDPPMPQTATVPPSGSTVRFKKTFINKYLSEQTARNIGIINYYVHVRKSFDGILKQLDLQVGKPMLLVRSENQNREPEELITLVSFHRPTLFVSMDYYCITSAAYYYLTVQLVMILLCQRMGIVT